MYIDHVNVVFFFFSSRRRHTRFDCDWSSACALPICLSAVVALLLLAARAAKLASMLSRLNRRSEERRVGKSVDLGGRRIIKKKKKKYSRDPINKKKKTIKILMSTACTILHTLIQLQV